MGRKTQRKGRGMRSKKEERWEEEGQKQWEKDDERAWDEREMGR